MLGYKYRRAVKKVSSDRETYRAIRIFNQVYVNFSKRNFWAAMNSDILSTVLKNFAFSGSYQDELKYPEYKNTQDDIHYAITTISRVFSETHNLP